MKKPTITFQGAPLPPLFGSHSPHFKSIFFISAMLVMLVASADKCWAGTATANGQTAGAGYMVSGGNFSTISASAAAAATINWTDGPDTVDGYIFPASSPGGPVKKFPNGAGTTFTFTGGQGPGHNLSKAITSGNGSSWSSTFTITVAGDTSTVTTYGAAFAAVATGTLGAGGDSNFPTNWTSKAKLGDPWPIYSSDLPITTGSSYNLWIPLEMSAGSSLGSINSSIGWDASYTDASGTIASLQISINGSHQVSVIGGTSEGNLNLYVINNVTDYFDFSDPISQSQLQSDLRTDIAGGALGSSVDIGIYLTDLPIPTVDIGDGSVGSTSVDAWASDSAMVPEPSTPAFVALSTLILLGFQRCRKAKGIGNPSQLSGEPIEPSEKVAHFVL